jgi:hypothetical protein
MLMARPQKPSMASPGAYISRPRDRWKLPVSAKPPIAASPCRLKTSEGGHFFLPTDAERLLFILSLLFLCFLLTFFLFEFAIHTNVDFPFLKSTFFYGSM